MRTAVIAVFMGLLVAAFAAPVFAEKAETRLIKFDRKWLGDRMKMKGGGTFQNYRRIKGEFEIPVFGGKVRGKVTEKVAWHFSETHRSTTQGRIAGAYDGKDDGIITLIVHWRNEDNDVNKFKGKVRATKGDGFIQLTKEDRLSFKFKPFAIGCNSKLSTYEGKFYEELLKKLIDASSDVVAKSVVKTVEFASGQAAKWLGRQNALSLTKRFEAAYRAAQFKDLYDTANDLLPDKFDQLAGNVTKVLTIIEIAESASAGDYKQVGTVVAWNVLGAYLPGGIVLVPLAQAAQADWQRYNRKRHEKVFRKFYVDLYYDGKRPNSRKGSGDRKLRLKNFVSLSLEYLATDDSLVGRPFRNMLRDFAYYQLQRSFSHADFNVVGEGTGARLANRGSGLALAALFRAYEAVYDKDRKSELMRRVTRHQSKKVVGALKRAEEAMAYALNGRFNKVWPDAATRKRVICGFVDGMKAAKLKAKK